MATLTYDQFACILGAFPRNFTIPFNINSRNGSHQEKLYILNKNIQQGNSQVPLDIAAFQKIIVHIRYHANLQHKLEGKQQTLNSLAFWLCCCISITPTGNAFSPPQVTSWSTFLLQALLAQFAICVILLLFLTISDCTQFSSYSHCTCEISSSSSF